jgi:monothiol glutaredoxin
MDVYASDFLLASIFIVLLCSINELIGMFEHVVDAMSTHYSITFKKINGQKTSGATKRRIHFKCHQQPTKRADGKRKPVKVKSNMMRFVLSLLIAASAVLTSSAFAPSPATFLSRGTSAANEALCMSDFSQETSAATQERIQTLVDENPVLLFMKGSKLFPQCGFSNTAVQILESFGIDFHTVDVLSDESIRSGVKEFSQWPTIPQLYVAGEFVGGSDIMIEMYQNGELAEMIEKAKADML